MYSRAHTLVEQSSGQSEGLIVNRLSVSLEFYHSTNISLSFPMSVHSVEDVRVFASLNCREGRFEHSLSSFIIMYTQLRSVSNLPDTS